MATLGEVSLAKLKAYLCSLRESENEVTWGSKTITTKVMTKKKVLMELIDNEVRTLEKVLDEYRNMTMAHAQPKKATKPETKE